MKKKLKRLVRRWAVAGPMGPQVVAGKDLSKEVGDLNERVKRIEGVLQGDLVKKFLKVQDSGKR